jgi:serine/threonine protein kinase
MALALKQQLQNGKYTVERQLKDGRFATTYLARDNQGKLIDFGISKEYIPNSKQQYTVALTPFFAAPEQYDANGEHGNYTDVYALAATMFYLVTGKTPTPANHRSKPFDDNFIPQLDDLNISDKVKNAILNGMALDPKRRFQSVDKWLSLLEDSDNGNEKNWGVGKIANRLIRKLGFDS